MQPDRRYNGEIGPGSSLQESRGGTLSYELVIHSAEEDGTKFETYYPIWITENNRKKAEETFQMLGVTPDMMNEEFIRGPLAKAITGCKIRFGTKEDTYYDPPTVKVSWIGAQKPVASADAVRSMAGFFAPQPAQAPQSWDQVPQERPVSEGSIVSDDDIPF